MKAKILFFFTPIYIVLIAFLLQSNMLLCSDVANQLNEVFQLFSGGRYISDIYETNPPMILYLYSLPCYIAKFASLDVMSLAQIYIFASAILSVALSFFLLKKIIAPKDRLALYFLLITLLFAIFLMPYRDFGQREHWLMILILPYLFSATLALENKSISKSLAILIGVMAGIGFAIKPFFLFSLCFIELFFIIKKRSLFGWVRIESVIIASILILYLASIFLLQPEYIKIMLPLVSHYYFKARLQPWSYIFSCPAVLIGMLTIPVYFLFYKKDHYKTLDTVMFLAMIGMMIAYMLPRESWYYHDFPSVCFALCIFASYLSQLIPIYRMKKTFLMFTLLNLSIYIYAGLVADMLVRQYVWCSTALDPTNTYQLKTFINSQPGPHSIYCFTKTGTQDCFPLAFLVHGSFGGRFPSFWWIKGVDNAMDSPTKNLPLAQIQQDKQMLIDSAAEDLNRYQPQWLIIDYSGAVGMFIFDFMKSNEKFRDAWQYYHYARTIKTYWIYERDTVPHPIDPQHIIVPPMGS